MAFCGATWKVLKKRAAPHAIWVRLLDSRTDAKIWVCSVYLGTGIDVREHHARIQTSVESWPGDRGAILLGADINTKIDWVADGSTCVPGGTSSKLHHVLNELATKNISPVLQHDPRVNTQWTRKQPSVGSQIDLFATDRCGRCTQVDVVPESRKIVGTDHEYIILGIVIIYGRVKQRRKGGPRILRSTLDAAPNLDQDQLEALSARYAAPSLKFVPPKQSKLWDCEKI